MSFHPYIFVGEGYVPQIGEIATNLLTIVTITNPAGHPSRVLDLCHPNKKGLDYLSELPVDLRLCFFFLRSTSCWDMLGWLLIKFF